LSNDWRYPSERKELVERLIAAEKANRLLEAELRDRVHREEMLLAGHPDVAALMARVRELEGIVVRLNEKIAHRRAS